MTKKALQAPRWVHFGVGNIFRVFIGGIADELITQGYLDWGLTCVETFDFEVVDKIYRPYDNYLELSVILRGDGTRENRVLGSMADFHDQEQWNRLKDVFKSQDLQFVSFTITEKGYALKKPNGEYFDYIQNGINNGLNQSTSAMAILTAMLWERYQDSQTPIVLVSMDNCSHNGNLLKSSVLTIAEEWQNKDFVNKDFVNYLNDEKKVVFLWTMIDKITPRPGESIADGLKDRELLKMGRQVVYVEGLPVVENLKIISPQDFLDELFDDCFPNEYLRDTNLRLSTDVSQGVGVRFSETIKAYVKRYGTAENLVAIPLKIVGWLRYTLRVDDQGQPYELAPDPMNEEFTELFKDIIIGIQQL